MTPRTLVASFASGALGVITAAVIWNIAVHREQGRWDQ